MPDALNQTPRTISVPGTLRVLERLNPYEFRVRIDIMREGVNNNKWDYRNLDKYYKTFLGQPILIAYVGKKIGDGHNMREEIAPDGGRVYTFMDGTAERIIGVLSEDEKDFALEQRDGNLWVVAKGKIFTFYAHEAVEKIIAAGAMDVSAETDVFETEEGPEGIEIFEKWAGLGVTILGDDVPPAIPGARIKQLAQIREDVNGLRLHAASLLKASEEHHDAPETKKEKGVKNTMNKRELAQLQKQFEGYTVLDASDDGMHVCLLNEQDGSFAGYSFDASDADRLVIPARIKAMRATTVFAFNDSEDGKVCVDACVPTDALAAKVIKQNSDIQAKDAKISDLEAQVKTMKANERARRIEACKEAVNRKFADMNAVREECFDAELAEKVCRMCDEGKFCEDYEDDDDDDDRREEGRRWRGDKTAVNTLMALCMEAQAEMDKKAANNKAKVFNAWTDAGAPAGNKGVDSVDKMFAFLDE